MKKFLFFLAVFFGSFFSVFSTTLAVGDNFLAPDSPGFVLPDCDLVDNNICKDIKDAQFRATVLKVVNYLLSFVGLIAVIAIIYYGFLWITSGGDEEQFTKGKKGVLYVGAGILLILLSYSIVNFLVSAGTGSINGIPSSSGIGITGTNSTTSSGISSVNTVRGKPNKNPNNPNNLPQIQARISATPSRGSAPLTVTFSALDSRDPRGITIPLQNYEWSYADENGDQQSLGRGPVISHTFETVASYGIHLKILSPDENQILSGSSDVLIRINPQQTRADFLINGDAVGSVVHLPLSLIKDGLSFDPSPSISAQGRKITEYKWRIDAQDHSFLTPDIFSYSLSKPGKYEISLRVTDNAGGFSLLRRQIIVESSMAIIDFSPQNPEMKKTVSFSGIQSSFESTDIVSYEWVLTNEQQEDTTFSSPRFSYIFPKSGVYNITLTIKNNDGLTKSTQKNIIVHSKPPVARLVVKKTSPATPATFFLDASTSFSSGEKPLLYSWDFDGDGVYDLENQKESTLEHTFSKKGTFSTRVLVRDVFGKTNTDTVNIVVSSLLNVDFSADTYAAQKDTRILFSANAPYAHSLFWDFGDNTDASDGDTQQKHVYTKSGKYTITLTAFDEDGNKNSIQKKIFIGDGQNPIPVSKVRIGNDFLVPTSNLCGAGKNGVILFRDEVLHFSANESVNVGGGKENLYFTWNFSDGSFKTGKDIQKRFTEPSSTGKCESATLTVKDTITGKTASSETLYVFVKNSPPTLSHISVPNSTKVCQAPCSVTIRAVNATDPDGHIVRYLWWAYYEGSDQRVDVHTTTEPKTTFVLPSHGLEGITNNVFFVVEMIDNSNARTNSEEILGQSKSLRVKNKENPAPLVNFISDRVLVKVGDEVTFASASLDPLGKDIPKTAYAWDFEDDGVFDDNFSGETVKHTFLKAGEYTIRLRITLRGVSESKTRIITVQEKKDAFSADFFVVPKNLRVFFDGAPSRFSNDENIEYLWDFNTDNDSDGNGVSDDDIDGRGVRVLHEYPKKGEYTAKLTIVRKDGSRDDFSQKVFLSKKNTTNIFNSSFSRSIEVSSNTPLATLSISTARSVLHPKESTEIFFEARDADGSLFSGDIILRIKSGLGTLSESVVTADSGVASVLFSSDILGESVVEAEFSSLVGDLSEEITLSVSETE